MCIVFIAVTLFRPLCGILRSGFYLGAFYFAAAAPTAAPAIKNQNLFCQICRRCTRRSFSIVRLNVCKDVFDAASSLDAAVKDRLTAVNSFCDVCSCLFASCNSCCSCSDGRFSLLYRSCSFINSLFCAVHSAVNCVHCPIGICLYAVVSPEVMHQPDRGHTTQHSNSSDNTIACIFFVVVMH